MLTLKPGNFALELQRGADEIEPADKGILRIPGDLEVEDALPKEDSFSRKVNLDLRPRASPNDALVCFRIKLDQKEAAIRGVTPKDIAVSGRACLSARDHGFEARLLNRPYSVLSRAPAAEVRADHQDRSIRSLRLV